MPRLIYPDTCPDCGDFLARSHRRGWLERIFTSCFRIGVFRCQRCGTRFYSPPAIVIRGLQTEQKRKREHPLVDEWDVPAVTLNPDPESPVKEVVVTASKMEKPDWPSARQNWTQQAVRNTPAGTPFLWVGSSTSHRRDDDSH